MCVVEPSVYNWMNQDTQHGHMTQGGGVDVEDRWLQQTHLGLHHFLHTTDFLETFGSVFILNILF